MREPYQYQIEGAAFLASPARRRSYLADEMGLGKTVQAILATRKLQPHRTSRPSSRTAN
jgi:SNF2 family DNA or RNA helicase